MNLTCYNHPDNPKGFECERCHKPICGKCLKKGPIYRFLEGGHYKTLLVCPKCKKIMDDDYNNGRSCECIVLFLLMFVMIFFSII